MQEPKHANVLRFGVFDVDLRSGELRKSGSKISLQEQPFKILTALLEHPGVVTREELRSLIWPQESFGDFDHAVCVAVAKLRTALGDSADVPRYVETLHRRGYRFIFPIVGANESDAKGSPKDPHHGDYSPRESQAALQPLNAGLAAASVRSRSREADQKTEKIRLIVLPFDNLGGDPQYEYFSDGLTEEMITRVGQLDPSHLGVIARSTTMRYKNVGKSIKDIGRELGVHYILEGGVRRAVDRVRVSVRLTDAWQTCCSCKPRLREPPRVRSVSP
jgi:TolB-like protein/DNA-binding winged helix-turn-helix (wHTH) protein